MTESNRFPFSWGRAILQVFLGLWMLAPSCGIAYAIAAEHASAPVESHDHSNGIDGHYMESRDNKIAASELLRETAWWRVAEKRGLDPYILYAVALVESAKVSKRIAKPWPWALNRQGRPLAPASQIDARGILYDTLARGIRNIDVGLMQVNIRWQGHRVRQPEDLLDPETNLRVGADVLAEAIGSAPGDLALGVGRYHAGSHDAARAYRYGRRVLAVARQIRRLI